MAHSWLCRSCAGTPGKASRKGKYLRIKKTLHTFPAMRKTYLLPLLIVSTDRQFLDFWEGLGRANTIWNPDCYL
eukprot:1146011-Pelagomonas_calceolata.AAC.1